MDILCWFSSDPQKYQPFADAFYKYNYETRWLDTLPSGPDIQKWISEKLPNNVAALFLEMTSVSEVAQAIRNLRSVDNQLTRTLPIFIVHQELTTQDWTDILNSGIDDFFNENQSPSDILRRLTLRRVQSVARAQLASHLKERFMLDTKREIEIKQREEFLNVCAHDLRSPLGVVQSSLGMILNSKSGLQSLHVELLTRAKRQVGHAITLVNDLLDITSIDQGLRPQFQLLDVDNLLLDFYNDFRFQAEQKGVLVQYENSLKGWRILADPERVRQLFQNLFTNALKFTNKGRGIYLSVSAFQGRRKTDPPYPMIIVDVRDEGCGIAPRELQRIFDRFTQVKEQARTEGRGLGLTVAKQISNLHDGNLWVQSEQGKGSTFHVLFPHVISRTQPSSIPKKDKKTILIVEPSLEKRSKYFEKATEKEGQIFYARDGVEAVTLCFHLMPDLVILSPDLTKMPENEVSELLHKESITSRIPIILAVEKENLKPLPSSPFDGVLRLPFTTEEWKSVVTSPRKQPSFGKAA